MKFPVQTVPFIDESIKRSFENDKRNRKKAFENISAD